MQLCRHNLQPLAVHCSLEQPAWLLATDALLHGAPKPASMHWAAKLAGTDTGATPQAACSP